MLNFGRVYDSENSRLQIWRSITSLFLHGNFGHIFSNSIATLIWGSLLDRLMGDSFIRMTLVWILSGFSGDCFSSSFSSTHDVSVGASTSIYGVFGCFFGFLLLNWKRLDAERYDKMSFTIGIIFILIFNVGMTLSNSNPLVDNKAHIGGFISGVFTGMAICDLKASTTNTFERMIKRLGVLCYIVFTVTFFTLFIVKSTLTSDD